LTDDDSVLDLSGLNRLMDDPALRDEFKLARRFGSAVRNHFRGRPADPIVVMHAAMGAIQAALRDVPEPQRAGVIELEVIERIVLFNDFLSGIGRPAEGEA
jgi:hypothetical protein